MTYAQWVWEFHALAEQEEKKDQEFREIFKLVARTFAETLIAVLGLRFEKENGKVTEKPKIDPKDMIPPFIPFSLLVAPVERIQDAQREAHFEDKIKDATKEGTSFDKMSEAIAAGDMDGDLAPFLDMIEGRITKNDYMDIQSGEATPEDLENNDTSQDDIREMMRSLGIEERPDDAPEAPHISARPKKTVEIDLFPEDWWGRGAK